MSLVSILFVLTDSGYNVNSRDLMFTRGIYIIYEHLIRLQTVWNNAAKDDWHYCVPNT